MSETPATSDEPTRGDYMALCPHPAWRCPTSHLCYREVRCRVADGVATPGPVVAPAARYDHCDGTCTVDCGHCKGKGRPAPAAAIAAAGAATELPPGPDLGAFVSPEHIIGWDGIEVPFDNHHNAAACPYCNPKRWEFVAPAAGAGALAERAAGRAEALAEAREHIMAELEMPALRDALGGVLRSDRIAVADILRVVRAHLRPTAIERGEASA